MDESSGFKIYSLAIAAENKEDGTNWILEVTPIELVPMLDGEVNARGERSENMSTDSTGRMYADSVVTANSIPAEWIGIGESNRRTCPNVRRGEELILYTLADSNKIFWTPRNKNSGLRCNETAVWAFAATPEEGNKALDDENSYVVEVSTHRKVILISTSQANGEKSRFFFQLNPGEGLATLADDHDNEITVDSLTPRISLINGEDVELHLQNKDLTVKVPGNESHDVSGNLTINVTGNVAVKAGGNAAVEAGGKASVKAPDIELAGKTKVNGDLEVTGSTKVAGLSASGYANFPAGHGPH